jgi:hypothetical protein
MRIPSESIPYCPVCGAPMLMNLRVDSTFVEERDWHISPDKYLDFIGCRKRLNILYPELGVDSNRPGIIKYPFWQITYHYPNSDS